MDPSPHPEVFSGHHAIAHWQRRRRPNCLVAFAFARIWHPWRCRVVERAPAAARPASANERFAVRLLFWWIVLPIASTLLVSLAAKPIFFSRFLLMCVPAIALLAAQGISVFARLFTRKKALAVAAVAALSLFLSLAETRRYFQTFPTYGNQWGAVVQHVLRNEQPGDAVVISMGIEPFEYYEHRDARGIEPSITFPPELGDGDRDFEPEPVLEQASLVHSRVWLVFPGNQKATIDANVPHELHRISETIFPGTADGELRVILFGKNWWSDGRGRGPVIQPKFCSRDGKIVLGCVDGDPGLMSLVETRRYFESFRYYGHRWASVVNYILANQKPGTPSRSRWVLSHFQCYANRQIQTGAPGTACHFPPGNWKRRS